MNQSEYETLMMAHDNLQRELVEIKRLMDKDKHALIKSNISLNKKVQELEEENKRYREALEKIARINIDQGTVTVSEVHAVLTAREALEGESDA